jgi:hypothetical protein
VVLFFVSAGCPISDRTFPEMKRVRESFRGRGVRVWFVYPNVNEVASEVEAHQRAFDAGGDALLDPAGDLVRLARARVTPEAAVLVPNGVNGWKPVYTGRVDDRFVHLGLERPQPKERFAQTAVEAVLNGKPVPRATGTPVGCGIISAGVGKGMSADAMRSMGSAGGPAVGDKSQP